MKKLFLILLLFIGYNSFSQRVYVAPDINKCWFYNIESLNNYLDYSAQLKIDYIPSVPPELISDRDCVKNTYESQVGIREATGHNDGKDVEMYLKSAGLSKSNAWCGAFVYWSITQCIDIKIQDPGWAPSWFPQSKLIYVRGKLDKRSPQYGDLIGIYFQDKKRIAHVGFYDSESKDFITTVEGNTNDAGSREGDGVYKKKRIKSQINSISNWIDH